MILFKQTINNKNYFFFPFPSPSASLKAPVKFLTASTRFFASSGIFFDPKSNTIITAMIIISFVPSPNILFCEIV